MNLDAFMAVYVNMILVFHYASLKFYLLSNHSSSYTPYLAFNSIQDYLTSHVTMSYIYS